MIDGSNTGLRSPTSGVRLALFAAAAIGLAGGLTPGPAQAQSASEKPMLMFVQVAEDLKVDAAAKTV
jgi:hypothetical protein